MKTSITLASLLIALTLTFAPVAQAQTALSPERLQQLLAQIATLRAQLAALQQAKAGMMSPVMQCPALSRALARGANGEDVTQLQRFLIAQNHLASDAATGLYGPMTEAAVQAFQRAQGIVSSGTPDGTGYGAVGPSTRAAILARCAQTNAGSNTTPTIPMGTPTKNTPTKATPSAASSELDAALDAIDEALEDAEDVEDIDDVEEEA